MIIRLTRNHCTPASLCSFVWTMLRLTNIAAYHGHKVWIDWTGQPALAYKDDNALLPANQWEWWFHQPMLPQKPDDFDEVWDYDTDGKFGTGPWQHRIPRADHFRDLPGPIKDQHDIHTFRSITKKHLWTWRSISDHADAFLQNSRILPSKTIAVLYRGTDNDTKGEGYHHAPLEDLFPTIDRLMKENTNVKIWVKTEEARHSAQLISRYYPHTVVVPDFHQATGGRMADFTNPKTGYWKGVDAIATVLMAAQCKWVLRNSSNLHDLAAGLSTSDSEHFLF